LGERRTYGGKIRNAASPTDIIVDILVFPCFQHMTIAFEEGKIDGRNYPLESMAKASFLGSILIFS
jgi:hypothetical protein